MDEPQVPKFNVNKEENPSEYSSNYDRTQPNVESNFNSGVIKNDEIDSKIASKEATPNRGRKDPKIPKPLSKAPKNNNGTQDNGVNHGRQQNHDVGTNNRNSQNNN